MLARFRSLFEAMRHRGRFEDQMREEHRFHIEAYAADLERAGVAPPEARRRARMEFGTTDAIADDCRQARGLRLFDELSQDLRFAGRLMVKTPGFTLAAIVSLALGIGANTAIFSLVDAVHLRTLPVEQPQQLFFLAHGSGERPNTSSNYPLFERYAALHDVFEAITAFSSTGFKVPTSDGVESADALWVSGNFHAAIGVPMQLGRGFATEPDRGAPSLVAVISDAYWSSHFGRDPNVLGRRLVIDGRSVAVIGVTAPEFTGLVPGQRADIMVPLSVRRLAESDFLDTHETWTSMPIVGRLRAGVSEAQALAAVEAVFQQYMSEKDNQWIKRRDPAGFAAAKLVNAAKGSNGLRQRYSTSLIVLMAMVAVVLAIASANVANLLLVRGSARAKEVAIRICVGGGRSRLIRQFLTEAALIAGGGALLGFVMAIWGASAIMAIFDALEAPLYLDVSPNLRVLAFTTGIAVVTALGLGLVPSIKSTRVDLTPALKENGGAAPHGSRRWMAGQLLVVSQLALCVLVVAVAGLLGQTLYKLRTLDAGFKDDRLLLFTVDSYGTPLNKEQRATMQAEILARLRTLPGVISVAASRSTPIHTSGNARALEIPGAPDTPDARSAWTNMVSPGYFDTFGITLVRGRDFNDQDRSGSQRVAIINQTMATFFFGSRDPIGRTFAFLNEAKNPWTVVGVTEDTLQMNLRDPALRMVYTPLAQTEAPHWINFELRTAQDPLALAPAAQSAVRSVSKDVLLRYVRTMDDQINASLVRERLLATLSAGFAVLAIVLAMVGLYGVMSFNVSRRTREIGIRIALGAHRSTVLSHVLRQTMAIALAGIALGIVAALAATRALSTLLFDLSERDPPTLGAVALLLLTTTLAAGLLPARRAATLDPVQAIRTE
jgi:predicted permease